MKKFAYFQACYCLVGVISFQTVNKMYWEVTADIFLQTRSDSMFRNRFERILPNLHLCGNEQFINNTNSRSSFLFNKSNKRFLKFRTNPSYDSLLRNSSQQAANKQQFNSREIEDLISCCRGIRLFYRPYGGAQKEKQVVLSTKWGLGENVALRLIMLNSNCQF